MTAKKTAKKTALGRDGIPSGYRKLGESYADTWKPETEGERVHGTVTGGVRSVDMPKRGRIPAGTRRVIEVTNHTGERLAVWESAALGELFDTLDGMKDNGVGAEVFIQYDGLGKKKAGQNPPKLFTVAIAA